MRRYFPGIFFILCAILSVALLLPGNVIVQAGSPQNAGKAGGKGAARAATPVFIAKTRLDDFVDQVEALGTLRANETVTLTATVTETVTAVNFEDGQRVKAGDLLLAMKTSEEEAELAAEASTMEEAKRQVDRLRSLVRAGASSEALLDQRQREYQTARARMDVIKSRISDRKIIAPFSGIVGLRNISVGAVLQPGMTITTLDDDSVMKLDFSVPAVFMTTLRPGLSIIATAAPFGDRQFKGEVYSVNSQVDPVTRAIMARALIPNEEQLLRPGLLMSVTLLKNPRKALVIPETAIVPEGQRFFVFTIAKDEKGGDIARKIPVQIGTRRPGEVEILNGLEVGTPVITHGTLKINDASPVLVQATERKPGEPLRELLQQQSTQERPQGKSN